MVGAGVLTPVVGSTLGSAQSQATTFTVRVENVSTGSTLATTGKGPLASQPVPLSPGAWAVHTPGEPVFSADEPERNNGLEELAEDGSPSRLADSLDGSSLVTSSGTFTTPVEGDSPGPIGPGQAYEFTVEAERPSDHLSLVTMFIPSNDLFYALGGAGGVRLEAGNGDGAVDGDVTGSVALWDAGTEINEEPGVGENQAQRQRGDGVGLVERETVTPVADINGYDYPDVSDVVQVTVTPSDGTGTPTTATPGTDTPSTDTPGTETPGTETPGEETPGTETPGEETPGEETPGEETPDTETPGEETPGEETPGTETPSEETPGEETPGTDTPGEETPGGETPGEETPDIDTPGEETPGEETPGETATPEETGTESG